MFLSTAHSLISNTANEVEDKLKGYIITSDQNPPSTPKCGVFGLSFPSQGKRNAPGHVLLPPSPQKK